MNRYGALAMKHWQRWLPNSYRSLTNPIRFFETLGDQVEAQIADQTTTATSDLPPNEDYLAAVGEYNAIRHQVEEQILTEWVYLEPEPQTQDPDEPRETLTGMPTDPDHPLWAMIEDDSTSAEEFLTALRQWRTTLPPQQ